MARKVLATLKDVDLVNSQVASHVMATAYKSLEAAAEYVRHQDYEPIILGDAIMVSLRN